MLIRIVAPYFVAGINIHSTNGSKHNNDCAPIVKYMKYWAPYEIKEYCDKKGWEYSVIYNDHT